MRYSEEIDAVFPCDSSSKIQLPLFHTGVQAGFPSPAENDLDRQLDLNELLISHPAATFFVRVVGDSMLNAGIRSGDLLVVDRALPAATGKIAVVILNGEFTVKRLSIQENKILLLPENPAYPVIEIEEGSDFQVWGIATYVIHKT